MKIYTKKGDGGQTFLFGGGPYPKDYPRIAAYGTVDELNSVVGCALAEVQDARLHSQVLEVQKQLFVVGAELASQNPSPEMIRGFIRDEHISALEGQMDAWDAELKPLKKFILPGGAKGAALFHLARTVCRRAERLVVALAREEPVRPELIKYLNRLSDWCFLLARVLNKKSGVEDVLWEGIL
jgi:cob(I)alamin adenosyltransferase